MKTILSRFVAIVCLIAPLTGAAQYTTSITTITNPRPHDINMFGSSVAAVGNDRVLISAINFPGSPSPYGGSAYLFNANGSLLTTFTNPAAAFYDDFGYSVTVLGGNKIIVGDPNDGTGDIASGAVHLFSTNGILLASITNPAPTRWAHFGAAMAAVGNDMVIVGAPMDDDLSYVGAAYLFDANGSLLTTFTNPVPTDTNSSCFGISVAALGNDRVLIGAGYYSSTVSGAAYLFNTNGTLLTTFTNPTPASGDLFGCAVAALGNNRVLIGARSDELNGVDAGTAYLFNTNGTLLTTFANPAPKGRDNFGCALTALGDDRILIGECIDGSAGAVFLFGTNGTLLTVYTNPAPPVDMDWFGRSVAVAGNGLIFIGAPLAEGGVGTAHLFSISSTVAPVLSIRNTPTNTLAVVWPSSSTGFTLQQNTNGVTTANWSNVTDLIQDDGTNRILIISPTADKLFYRLFKP